MQGFKVRKGVCVTLLVDFNSGTLSLVHNGRIAKRYVQGGLTGPLVWAVDLKQVVVHEVWAQGTQMQRYEPKLCLRPSVRVELP